MGHGGTVERICCSLWMHAGEFCSCSHLSVGTLYVGIYLQCAWKKKQSESRKIYLFKRRNRKEWRKLFVSLFLTFLHLSLHQQKNSTAFLPHRCLQRCANMCKEEKKVKLKWKKCRKFISSLWKSDSSLTLCSLPCLSWNENLVVCEYFSFRLCFNTQSSQFQN